MDDKEQFLIEIAMPLPVKAGDPFLRIRKRMGPTVDLEAEKHTKVVEREALAPCHRAPSQSGNEKNTILVVKAILHNPKGKGKVHLSPKIQKSARGAPVEGVPRKRRLVLKSAMLTKKAKVKILL